MIGALTSWVDFSSFTTTSSESASYSFALLKRASWKQAMATLLISLVSKMRLPHCARGHKPSTSLEQASSKGGAWDHITANMLPWQATDWAPQLSSFPLTWHSERFLIFVSWTPTPITACGNATTHTFLLPLMLDEKKSFPTATKLFQIHLDFLHSPILPLQLCNSLTAVRLLAAISFVCTPPSWLYFSVTSCAF